MTSPPPLAKHHGPRESTEVLIPTAGSSLHSLRTHILFVRAFPDLPHPALRSHAATFRSPPALPALKAPFTPPARPRSTITTTATTTSPLPPISAPTNTSSNANDTSSSLSAPKINLHLLLHRTTHPFTDLLSLPRLPHLHTLILSDPTVASPSSGPGVAPVSLNAESLVRAWGRLASDAAVAASRPPDTNTGDLGRSRDPPFAHLALLLLRGPAASLPPRGFAVLAQLPRLVLLGVERPFGDETGEEEGADDGGSGGGGKGGRDALPETYRRFPGAPSQTAAPHEGRTRRRGKATSTPDARGEEPGAGLWDPVPPTSVTGRLLMSAQLRCSIAGDPRRPGGGAADAMHKALQTYAKIADTLLDGRGGIGVGKAGTVGSGEEGKVNSGAREEVPGADRPIAKISLVLGGGAADSEGGGGGRSGGRFAWYKRREGAVPPDADTEGQRAGAGRGRGASGKMVVRSVRRVDIGDLLRSFEG